MLVLGGPIQTKSPDKMRRIVVVVMDRQLGEIKEYA